MRALVRSSLIGATALVLAGAAAGSPVGPERADAAKNACQEPLNPDRRTAYRFTDRGKTLAFGQVVMTATKADGHRYCVRIGFGGRTMLHEFSQASYLRRNGRWVYEGALGSGAYRTGGYTQSVQVRDKTRSDRTFAVRHKGRWYRTISISRYNL